MTENKIEWNPDDEYGNPIYPIRVVNASGELALSLVSEKGVELDLDNLRYSAPDDASSLALTEVVDLKRIEEETPYYSPYVTVNDVYSLGTRLY